MNKLDKHLIEDDISKIDYIGIIEDINDPLQIGRAKVRVFGKFGHADGENEIPTEHLPWAYPEFGFFGDTTGAGSFSTPKLDTEVKVRFINDNIYYPKYSTLENVSEALLDDIKDSYENAHVLLHDLPEKVKIYYTQEKGLLIHNDDSIINILNDNSILISHKDKSAEIEFRGNDIDIVTNSSINGSAPDNINFNSNNIHVNGVNTDVGANPIFSSVNGEILMQLLKIMATTIDAKVPITPSATVNVVAQMEQLILSQTVKVSP